MTWVIAQLVGITNIFLLLAVAVLGNILLQLMGHLMEEMNVNHKETKKINWWPTIIGWAIFVGQWACILTYFIVPAVIDSVGPPAFVWVIIIGLVAIFAIFGLVQLLHYAPWGPRWLSTTYGVEIAYIILSLTSKLFLTWTLLGALIRAQLVGP